MFLIISLPVFYIFYFIIIPEIQYKVYFYKLNKISIEDLSQTYTDTRFGFAFKHPAKANVYVIDDKNSGWRRVFAGGDNKGSSCDFVINSYKPELKAESQKVTLGNYDWEKWKLHYKDKFGWRDPVLWYMEQGDLRFYIMTEKELEHYCEMIISTLKLVK